MSNKINNTTENVSNAVSSLYSTLLDKRKQQKEEYELKHIEEKERKKEEKRKKDYDENDDHKLSKKERRERELNNWKEVVIGLTGDDLEYSDVKNKKKKYRKWISDETTVGLTGDKPKKPKKKNYQKEFDPELNMLKRLVADQNNFTSDMQKRLNLMMGPNTKDASPLNKTEVELASVIVSSRNNALGFIKEIGNLKKTIADLYLRQKKQDFDISGGKNSDIDMTDLALMGSSLASQMSSSSIEYTQPAVQQQAQPQQQSSTQTITGVSASSIGTSNNMPIIAESFDPSTWNNEDVKVNDSVYYESTPHEFIVEWDKNADRARFKAVRTDNGEELKGCPVPTVSPSKLTFNEEKLTVKGPFDEIYKLEII